MLGQRHRAERRHSFRSKPAHLAAHRPPALPDAGRIRRGPATRCAINWCRSRSGRSKAASNCPSAQAGKSRSTSMALRRCGPIADNVVSIRGSCKSRSGSAQALPDASAHRARDELKPVGGCAARGSSAAAMDRSTSGLIRQGSFCRATVSCRGVSWPPCWTSPPRSHRSQPSGRGRRRRPRACRSRFRPRCLRAP